MCVWCTIHFICCYRIKLSLLRMCIVWVRWIWNFNGLIVIKSNFRVLYNYMLWSTFHRKCYPFLFGYVILFNVIMGMAEIHLSSLRAHKPLQDVVMYDKVLWIKMQQTALINERNPSYWTHFISVFLLTNIVRHKVQPKISNLIKLMSYHPCL